MTNATAPSPSPALRIAFFTDTFAPTNDGVAKVTDTLASGLRTLGHEVTVFTVCRPGSAPWEVRRDGVRIRRLMAVPAPGYPQYRIALPPWRVGVPGGGRFDVIHLHTPGFVGLAGWLYARRRRISTVGTYHTNLSEMLRGAGKHRTSEALFRAWGRFAADLCRSCDLATAPTDVSRDALLKTGRMTPGGDIWVVPNGVDTDTFRPGVGTPDWRRRCGLGSGVPVVTFLGRLTREKGALRFLDALERLGTSGEWRALIGGEGPQAEALRGRVRPGQPLGDRVLFLGPVAESEKPALLAQSQVFVLPSVGDTSSVALLEAMACGIASVVTARGGPAEIARRSSAGLIVDPDDAGQVATAIAQLLSDTPLRREHGGRGRAWVVANASAATMAAGFADCYASLLRPGEGAAGSRPFRSTRERPSPR